MTRPLRIEYPGALYHVMARGDRRRPLFLKDDDYRQLLARLGLACERFNFVVHAYCLMPNHYHLMVETIDGALGRGIGYLNASYSQLFNRRYDLVGHVFQGRYKAILVQKEDYLLQLSRYIMLNPVRARLTRHAEEWRWSSYRHTMGRADCPAWLQREWLLSRFGRDVVKATAAFQKFVDEGIGGPNPLLAARHQMILGDDEFVEQSRRRRLSSSMTAIAKVQRRLQAATLQEYQDAFESKDEAIARAYHSTAYTMVEIGAHFDMLPNSVSRAIRRFELADRKARDG